MVFKKKEDKKTGKEVKTSENEGIKKEYKVILKEKITKGTTRTVREFDAGRWKDPLDGVIYLKSIENQKTPINFIEIFPGDVKNFVKMNKSEIEKKLKDLNKKLDEENRVDDPDVNQKNFEYDIMKLEAQLRSLEYNNDAAYFSFSLDAQPEIIYLRESDYFTPFKWDTETTTVYQPSEAKKKSVVATLRNKEAKYKNNDKVTATAIILLIVGVVLTLGNIFGGVKVWSMYDESKIAELEASSLMTLDSCSIAVSNTNMELVKTAQEVKTIAETLTDKVTQPQITGIIPQ